MFLDNAFVVLTVCSDDMAQLMVNSHGVPDPIDAYESVGVDHLSY
jgi:hypothetical protein